MTKVRNHQQVLDALGEYQRKGAIHIDKETINTMVAQESDRGIVIILGSFVEDKLLERILELSPDGEANRNRLAKGGGPLKDFASRTLVAKALGIINDDQAQFIDVIRHMRNACSHSRQDITLETQELRDVLALLYVGQDAKDIANNAEHGMLQMAFVAAAGFVLGILSGETEAGW